MKVYERMSRDPVTIAPETSVDQALKLMQERGIRHLPVIADGRLAGMVTDVDLRTAWFPSLLEDLTVADLMDPEPAVVSAQASIFEAARLVHRLGVTGLAAIDGERLVGIITLADLLGVMVEIMGLLEETVRLDVTLPPGGLGLDEVSAIVAQQGGDILSIARLANRPAQGKGFCLRLAQGADLAAITQAIRQRGGQVTV